jgi:hypothetical protein
MTEMSNRRWVAVLLLTLLIVGAGIGIAVGAYHAGFTHAAVEHGARIVYAGPHYGGWGFFPFGLFLFPLFLIFIFVLLRAAFGGPRRMGWGGPGWGQYGPAGQGPWGPGGPRERMEAWHREAHERESAGTGPPAPAE